jgi:indolepyruvate ferredoxin oxidoreductase alpha subunit
MKNIIMGNAAIALGALHAGVDLVCGYPGTPSTEILQTVADKNDGSVYVEWSTNEKAAVEVAAGAAYAGAKTLVTMKQVGLNVASDPVMCLSYIGTGSGAMVIAVADDPGPISSQTEQDTRAFAKYANIPLLDPSSPEEAYEMTKYAFALSERLGKPVIIRPTTRVCHATAALDVADSFERKQKIGGFTFKKDPKYVIFPPLSNKRHSEFSKIFERLSEQFDESPFNKLKKSQRTLGIATGGVTAAILSDVLSDLNIDDVNLLKIGTAFPAPVGIYEDFVNHCEKILVLEELSPFIEEEILKTVTFSGERPEVFGKLAGDVPVAGELTYEIIRKIVVSFLNVEAEIEAATGSENIPDMPMRAPVLCAGCPHRASFYAVKTAMKKESIVNFQYVC